MVKELGHHLVESQEFACGGAVPEAKGQGAWPWSKWLEMVELSQTSYDESFHPHFPDIVEIHGNPNIRLIHLVDGHHFISFLHV